MRPAKKVTIELSLETAKELFHRLTYKESPKWVELRKALAGQNQFCLHCGQPIKKKNEDNR